jgi:hypothetical protein
LLGQSEREGQLPTALREIDIEVVDPGKYPQRRITDQLRADLMRRDGIEEAKILEEILRGSLLG